MTSSNPRGSERERESESVFRHTFYANPIATFYEAMLTSAMHFWGRISDKFIIVLGSLFPSGEKKSFTNKQRRGPPENRAERVEGRETSKSCNLGTLYFTENKHTLCIVQ